MTQLQTISVKQGNDFYLYQLLLLVLMWLSSPVFYSFLSSQSSSTPSSRYKPWPRVADFLLSLPPTSLVYDIGCGNGKYLTVNPNLLMVGCDSSFNLLAISNEKGMESIVAEVSTLPFKSSSADHFICIAVLHHLSSESRRISALNELTRILKPGGSGLIYVWAFEQKGKEGTSSNYTSKSNSVSDVSLTHNSSKQQSTLEEQMNILESRSSCNIEENEVEEEEGKEKKLIHLLIHQSRTPFKQQDVSWLVFKVFFSCSNNSSFQVLVPWKLSGSKNSFLRYYHVFKENELNLLCEKVPELIVSDSYYDDGNWCIKIEKKLYHHHHSC